MDVAAEHNAIQISQQLPVNEMRVYLDGNEICSATGDIGEILDTARIKNDLHAPKSFECEITWKIGYGMDYVDDMRRRRWCNSFRYGGKKQ